MNNTVKSFGLVIVFILAVLAYSSCYVVDETQQVVITQFGKVVGKPIKTAGLKFKLPFFQVANYFPKNLLTWDGDPGQVPTKDKTYIWVDTFARWKIVDPVKYFQTVNNEFAALERLDDIIGPSMRNLVTSYPLVESVRNSSRPMDTLNPWIMKTENGLNIKLTWAVMRLQNES
jgi:membrane protease subunit HflC